MESYPGCTLHQVGPYIGKIRPSLARLLVTQYSKRGDWLWDPFCGSGTIPLEARLLSRHVVAADVNPYACALTRAKLHAPVSANFSISQLNLSAKVLKRLDSERTNCAPRWVRKFFNPDTLKETKALMEEFARKHRYFHIGCLLGILHHQRPGFLSYPASHLVPYLRDRLYPRRLYPAWYEYRDPISRLKAKIKRVLNCAPPPAKSHFSVLQESIFRNYLPEGSMDGVITSPPYMDALDYARDNRLRLWFLGCQEYKTIKENEIGKVGTFSDDMLRALQKMVQIVKPGGFCILVLGNVMRANRNYDVPAKICHLVKTATGNLRLENQWVEKLPDNRRVRKNGRATRQETILVFRRTKRG